MGIESATYVSDLVSTNPASDDLRKDGDNHMRLMKAVLKTTFPDATKPFRFPKIVSKTANYTVLYTDDGTLFLVDATLGNVTISLPAVAAQVNAMRISVKKVDASANTVTLDGNSSETIDGAATFVLTDRYEQVDIATNVSAWYTTTYYKTGLSGFAPKADPAFTGNPTAPTASPGDSDTSIANTAFVAAAILAYRTTEAICIAVTSEIGLVVAGTGKFTFRLPYAFTVTAVRATLKTAQVSGNILTIDINEAGTTILSTKLTIDNTEKTSTTAAAAAAISDASLADDAEITIDVDQIGNGTAAGLKVYLIGHRT